MGFLDKPNSGLALGQGSLFWKQPYNSPTTPIVIILRVALRTKDDISKAWDQATCHHS